MSTVTKRKPQTWGCDTCPARIVETTTVPLNAAGHWCPKVRKWSDFKVVK